MLSAFICVHLRRRVFVGQPISDRVNRYLLTQVLITEVVNPSKFGIPPEPGPLALGVLASRDVSGFDRLFNRALASKNFEFVVLAVNIQRQVGGSLSEILDMVADTVRGRVQFARKVRALTAMGRASAYVLVGMPFALAFMIFLIDPSYVRPLWAESAGHIMVVIGLISMTLGGLVVRKIVNFKY